MHALASVTAATVMILSGTASFASCNSPSQPLQVGAVEDNAEKDTFGFICDRADVSQTGSIVKAPPASAVQVGGNADDPEKDTFGYPRTASEP